MFASKSLFLNEKRRKEIVLSRLYVDQGYLSNRKRSPAAVEVCISKTDDLFLIFICVFGDLCLGSSISRRRL